MEKSKRKALGDLNPNVTTPKPKRRRPSHGSKEPGIPTLEACTAAEQQILAYTEGCQKLHENADEDEDEDEEGEEDANLVVRHGQTLPIWMARVLSDASVPPDDITPFMEEAIQVDQEDVNRFQQRCHDLIAWLICNIETIETQSRDLDPSQRPICPSFISLIKRLDISDIKASFLDAIPQQSQSLLGRKDLKPTDLLRLPSVHKSFTHWGVYINLATANTDRDVIRIYVGSSVAAKSYPGIIGRVETHQKLSKKSFFQLRPANLSFHYQLTCQPTITNNFRALALFKMEASSAQATIIAETLLMVYLSAMSYPMTNMVSIYSNWRASTDLPQFNILGLNRSLPLTFPARNVGLTRRRMYVQWLQHNNLKDVCLRCYEPLESGMGKGAFTTRRCLVCADAERKMYETPKVKKRRLARSQEYNRKRRQMETPEAREARLAKEKARRLAMTPEEKEERADKNRKSLQARLQAETPEQRETRLADGQEYYQARLQAETPEQRETRLAKDREIRRARRQAETPEEKERRRAKVRETLRARRQAETPEEKERRLAKNRERNQEYQQVRQQAQTPEERQQMLARQKARRLAMTPEEKERRTTSNRESRQARELAETPEQRETRLAKQRENRQAREVAETPEQRETRVAKKREYRQARELAETPEQRETRLAEKRAKGRLAEKRAKGRQAE